MAYDPVDLVVVSAWGKRVGALAQDPRTGFFASVRYLITRGLAAPTIAEIGRNLQLINGRR
jgi:hypothetical protein